MPFRFSPVLLDLELLLLLPSLLGLKLVTYQGASEQSHRSANQSACGRMTNGAADDSPRACAQAGPDKPSLLPNGERT